MKETIIVIMQFLTVVLTSVFLIYNLRELIKKLTFGILIIYPVFYYFYSFPLLLGLLLGETDYYPFINASYAVNDFISQLIYCLFISFFTIIIWFIYSSHKKKMLKKTSEEDKRINALITDDNYNRKIKKVENISYILTFVPFVYFLINPQYWSLVTAGFGSRYTGSAQVIMPETLLQIGIWSYIIFVAISRKNMLKFALPTLMIIFYAYINGKRYMIIETIILVIFALIISQKVKIKSVLKLAVILVPMLVIGAYYYQVVYKPTGDFYDFFKIDMSRDYTLLYSIFTSITEQKILNYPGESLLYSIIFYFPRELFPWKPWPFSQFITSSMMGYDISIVGTLGWSTTTGIFSEFVANFGLWGLILSAVLVMYLIFKIDKVKSNMSKILLVILTIRLLTVEFSSMAVSFTVVIFVIYIFSKVKTRKHNGKKQIPY